MQMMCPWLPWFLAASGKSGRESSDGFAVPHPNPAFYGAEGGIARHQFSSREGPRSLCRCVDKRLRGLDSRFLLKVTPWGRCQICGKSHQP